MSILSAADVASPIGLLFLFACSLVGMAIAGFAGLFSERDANVLPRLFPADSVNRLFVDALIAVFVFLTTAVVFGAFLRFQNGGQVPQNDDGLPSPGAMILLNFIVPLATLIWLIIGVRFVVQNGPRRVGLIGQPIGEAIAMAIGILLAAFPLIFLAANLSEMVYNHFGWEHERAHELLLSMGEAEHQWQKVLAIVTAVVLAPMGEELLFRGHVQAGIRRLILRPAIMMAPVMMPPVAAVVPNMPAEAAIDSTVLPTNVPVKSLVIEYAPVSAHRRSFIASASAVVITSVIFALIHPAWSRAPIFVLSIFLGIAYERRGNLWTNIFIHALFNGTMVAGYLSTPHAAA